MKVRSCMSASVKVIDPETSVRDAACMMRDGDFGAIPVGTEDRLVGMVTDRDITVRAAAEGLDLNTVPVDDIMSKAIIYCFADESLEDAAQKMADHKVRRLIVLDETARFVGILSLGDLAKFQDESLDGGFARTQISETKHQGSERH